jgi:hypothetical protein
MQMLLEKHAIRGAALREASVQRAPREAELLGRARERKPRVARGLERLLEPGEQEILALEPTRLRLELRHRAREHGGIGHRTGEREPGGPQRGPRLRPFEAHLAVEMLPIALRVGGRGIGELEARLAHRPSQHRLDERL